MERKSMKVTKAETDALMVDAAMRWTKFVRKGPQEDFLQAQRDLVAICDLRRVLDRVDP